MQRYGGGPESTGRGNRVRYEMDALKKWVRETLCVSPTQLEL
jgi:hypothetical protein